MRATAEYRLALCTATSTPMSSITRRWRASSAQLARTQRAIKATTTAVVTLRTATAVATSTPWSSATRAATWLAPNIVASSSSSRKAPGDIGADDNARYHAPMTTIWKQALSVDGLTRLHVGTTVEHLGIEFLEVGADFIRARAPVDARTKQPAGILHGGISVVLAETLGSCGAAFSVPAGQRVVGLDINANHVRSATAGWVTGVARPLHRGRTTQVWQIELHDDAGRLTCVSRITMAVLERPD
jgi:1,4-dihydroxy-2-naphthoyl-CoA hydrolase